MSAWLHHFDRRRAEEAYEFSIELVDTKRRQVDTDLAGLASATLERARLAAALHGDDPLVVDRFRDAARCGAAMFAVGRAGGRAVRVPLLDDVPVNLEGKIPASLRGASEWLDTAWCCVAARDMASLALLSAVPDDALRPSGVTTPAYFSSLIRAVRAFFAGAGSVGPPLLQALRETDPQALDPRAVEWVMYVDVPLLDLFRAVAEGEAAAVDAKLRRALDDHRTFFSRDPFEQAGLIALGATALACAAADRDIPISIRSPYLPAALIRARAPDPVLVCCPYCLIPMAPGVAVCPACLLDPTTDAPVELDGTEWRARPRKSCPHCSAALLDLAVVCPSCRTRQ